MAKRYGWLDLLPPPPPPHNHNPGNHYKSREQMIIDRYS
jgi:hypothetical protein